mmetsp:Transcript_1506/g.2241  ORF Transcript_1506/g.2241 Transcript_1506/m.2241 type:complete len:104 (+) Transcript_1506:5334-5645(+)
MGPIGHQRSGVPGKILKLDVFALQSMCTCDIKKFNKKYDFFRSRVRVLAISMQCQLNLDCSKVYVLRILRLKRKVLDFSECASLRLCLNSVLPQHRELFQYHS